MDAFLENAQRIFDVARSDGGTESGDFALLIRPDGGLHVVMESTLSLDATAADCGAQIAYRVTKTVGGGVRVFGRTGNRECVLEQRPTNCGANARLSLRDQALYLITSPLTLCPAK